MSGCDISSAVRVYLLWSVGFVTLILQRTKKAAYFVHKSPDPKIPKGKKVKQKIVKKKKKEKPEI